MVVTDAVILSPKKLKIICHKKKFFIINYGKIKKFYNTTP